MANFYTIKNASNAEPVRINIYGQIGDDYWGDGVNAKTFVTDLDALGNVDLDVHINSPGGAVFDGQAIFNRLKQHPGTVNVYIDGLAASIASVIAMAGKKIYMSESAMLMIHNPIGLVYGESEEMRKNADTLDKIKATILNAYTSKSSLLDSELSLLMDNETWLTAEEAEEYGFIDEILNLKAEPFESKANIFNKFRKLPSNLALNFLETKKTVPTAKNTRLYKSEEVLSIQNLCNMVDKSEKAKDFIKLGLKENQVKEALFDAMLKDDNQHYINNKVPEKPAEDYKKSWSEASKKSKWGNKL